MVCGKKNSQQKSDVIDKTLEQEKSKSSKDIKLLLLGAGESGKSTIFKQMKIIHHNGYSREECIVYRDIIFANVLQCMQSLIQATVKLSIPIKDPENRERAQRISNMDTDHLMQVSKMFTPELGRDIKSLWQDEGIQRTFANRSHFQLNDSAEYYFSQIDRISAPGYIPTEQDVLRSRVKTTGIVETSFDYGGFHFTLFDVGGQRNERKKWIHCFEGVTAIIFVSALSEYDQKCYEDDTSNRMQESLVLFDEICNARWFKETPIILFLNKYDLFKEKIQKISLDSVFSDFNGGKSVEEAAAYIAKKYTEKNRRQEKPIFTHFTCATDTNNIKNVFDAIKDIILHNHIQ